MSRKFAYSLAALAAAAALFFVFKPSGPRAPVKVVLRLAAAPKEKSDFVAVQANTARFKYSIGKKAGLKPVLAQRLAVRVVPNTRLVEAQLGVETRAQARLYADAFVETLQAECGSGVALTLVERSVQ
ncbi:MAG: hypothetical protein JXQ71_11620 [Verrucomicrobia bacterium]|nr:hypothetical protein [Verrucomicrobiota bacterium]